MACGRLHTEDRFAGVLDKLIQDNLVIVGRLLFELGERAYSDHITVGAHHRDRLKDMLRFIAIHDHPFFCFQLPGALVDVEYNYIHAEVQPRFLGT